MAEEKFETVVFKKKTFGDLLNEIHTNSRNTDKILFEMIQDMKDLIETLGDAIQMAPIIATYVKMSIDNNDHIIKLASIVQKCLDRAKAANDETLTAFTEDDRKELEAIMLDYQESVKVPELAAPPPVVAAMEDKKVKKGFQKKVKEDVQ